jgi:thiamine biosynthesis protein ThiS
MELIINGDRRPIAPVSTVADMLAALDLDPRAVVVELNRIIIRRPDVAATAVTDGDHVEIVHFVGGG